MAAEALNCPNCGAGVESDRSLCEFCKTRLKTVACTSCFGLMFLGSQFCGHCGAIAAPVEVSLTTQAGDCPRCRSPLENLKVDSTEIDGCTKCDGVWVDVATFENICSDRERQSAVLGLINTRTLRGMPQTKVNYVPCPTCGELMNRNNFARASGVIIDICKRHGVWFDADELPAIIEFIRKGGMEIARQREKDELRQERDHLREEQRRSAALDRRFPTDNALESEESGAIRTFVLSLFS